MATTSNGEKFDFPEAHLVILRRFILISGVNTNNDCFYLDTQFLFAVSCSSVSSAKENMFHHWS